MAAEELLLVLVVEVFDDQEPTDVVNNSILVIWVIVDSVLVLAVESDRVLKLQQLSGSGLALARDLLGVMILHI